MIRSQQEEICKYKWIESEKAGQDIGWERATREWMQKHFPSWKHYRWNRFLKEAASIHPVAAQWDRDRWDRFIEETLHTKGSLNYNHHAHLRSGSVTRSN